MPAIGPCFYFGCYREAGHYLWSENGGRLYTDEAVPADFPLPPKYLDGGLLPPRQPEEQGRASLVHFYTGRGWTVLTFWDFSVDDRPGCNSAFILPGIRDFGDACVVAEEKFPPIWRRFTFPITESR